MSFFVFCYILLTNWILKINGMNIGKLLCQNKHISDKIIFYITQIQIIWKTENIFWYIYLLLLVDQWIIFRYKLGSLTLFFFLLKWRMIKLRSPPKYFCSYLKLLSKINFFLSYSRCRAIHLFSKGIPIITILNEFKN